MLRCEHNVVNQKGKFISGGLSGIVELLPSGLIIKSPWPGEQRHDSIRQIANEFQIYKHLGPHRRLVPVKGYTAEGELLMENMPNGNLAEYLRTHSEAISMSQRLQWAWDAAEGLLFLHLNGVMHRDVKPKNFLLDATFGLRIADFASSSLNGSHVSASGSTRFSLPRRAGEQATTRSDVFGLGSTTYEIMTGKSPYGELDSDEVVRLFKAKDFPAITGTPCDEFIQQCWNGEITSAQEAYDHINALVTMWADLPLIL
jgi:serine/threonine protein kinase